MRLSKKFAALAITATVAVTATAAFAFWSADGSGTGSGTASAAAADVNVTQTSTVSAMHPGDDPQTLSGTFTNTGDAPAYIANVTASISSVDSTAGTCTADDFILAHEVMDVSDTVITGDAWGGATLQFNNLNENQDDCKGATVNLDYDVNGS